MMKTHRHAPLGSYFAAATLCGLLLLGAACTVSRNVTQRQRSSIEQQLLIRSLERAVARLDLQGFKQRRVSVDVYGFTADRDFAREFIKARFQERGLQVVSDAKSAELHLKVFLNALGVDRAERLLGIPQLAAPVIGTPTPEIALFKSIYNRGYAEVDVYAVDDKSERFVEKTARVTGEANYDDYTLLVFVNFNLDDLDEKPAEARDGGF